MKSQELIEKKINTETFLCKATLKWQCVHVVGHTHLYLYVWSKHMIESWVDNSDTQTKPIFAYHTFTQNLLFTPKKPWPLSPFHLRTRQVLLCVFVSCHRKLVFSYLVFCGCVCLSHVNLPPSVSMHFVTFAIMFLLPSSLHYLLVGLTYINFYNTWFFL